MIAIQTSNVQMENGELAGVIQLIKLFIQFFFCEILKFYARLSDVCFEYVLKLRTYIFRKSCLVTYKFSGSSHFEEIFVIQIKTWKVRKKVSPYITPTITPPLPSLRCNSCFGHSLSLLMQKTSKHYSELSITRISTGNWKPFEL